MLWLGFINPVSAFVDVPKLESLVTDLTGTLTPGQAQELENKLREFEARKGSQIAVVIVATTQPEDIAEFGIKVADLNQLGRKQHDDGLILIIAKNDRRLRWEVYDGLEGVIPDAIANRIITETITPYFKQNDYFGGINAGIDQVMTLIEGEQLPEPERQNGYQGSGDSPYLFVLFCGLFAGSVLSSVFGRVAGALIAGIGSTLVASTIVGLGFGSILVGLIVFFLLSARFGGGGGWSNGGGYGGGYHGGDSWGGGGGSSWGGGGGGHASGGGASGSW